MRPWQLTTDLPGCSYHIVALAIPASLYVLETCCPRTNGQNCSLLEKCARSRARNRLSGTVNDRRCRSISLDRARGAQKRHGGPQRSARGYLQNSKVLCVLHQSVHVYGMTCTLYDLHMCRAFITAKMKGWVCVHQKKQTTRRGNLSGLAGWFESFDRYRRRTVRREYARQQRVGPLCAAWS